MFEEVLTIIFTRGTRRTPSTANGQSTRKPAKLAIQAPGGQGPQIDEEGREESKYRRCSGEGGMVELGKQSSRSAKEVYGEDLCLRIELRDGVYLLSGHAYE